jgi:hypothetical protein
MTETTDARGKRLAHLKREVTKRDFDRHVSVLKCVTDLPVELQSPSLATLVAAEAIQTIVLFPPQIHRGWDYTPRQVLLFTPTGIIHLLSSIWPDQEPQITQIKGQGLMYLRATLLLLYGFLEIVSQGPGSPARLSLEFNTVAWPCLSWPLRQLLQTAKDTGSATINEGCCPMTIQQAVEKLPLKFSNGAKIYGLLPGEGLDELVFQPGTWKRWMLFFRQPVTANTLLLLTSNYMTVIQEELKIAQGWILSYIPRECITGMQNRPHGLYNELIVQLQRGDQTAAYKLLLERGTIEAWRTCWIQRGGLWQDISE